MLKLDHIGITVNNLTDAIKYYQDIFQIKEYETWKVTANKNDTAYLTIYEDTEKQKKNISFEIMQPFKEADEECPEEDDSGFFHMAFLAEDYDAEYERLKKIPGIEIESKPSVDLDPEYKHAMIEPCEYTNFVRIYIFNKTLDHSLLEDYKYIKCE